jgi:hypothetical protein
MKIEPNRLSQALASAYGASTPRPMSTLRHLPCPKCAGQRRSLTVCQVCGGTERVMVLR